jgi:hypothetical protein
VGQKAEMGWMPDGLRVRKIKKKNGKEWLAETLGLKSS